MAEIWILEAQLANGGWRRCSGRYATEKDAQHEIANRSTGRYRIVYRTRRYVEVEDA